MVSTPSPTDLLTIFATAIGRARTAQSVEEARAAIGSAADAVGASTEAASAKVLLDAIEQLAVESVQLRGELAAATRARESLLASVSHDLRNPLNTFSMSAGLLRDDIERGDFDPTRAAGLTSRMERASARMQALIEDLIEASHIDAGKIDLARRQERAAQLVRDALSASKSLASERRTTIREDAVEDDVLVSVDRPRLLEVLGRLIAFGVKMTGEGGLVRVGVIRRGTRAVFYAHADLPGTAQVPSPDEARGGLALLIARGIVALHGGVMDVDTTSGLRMSFALDTE
ncbi:Sensory box histidine kinase [Labilithrix luteola]|uniref:histidine kinase n=1 Tax=Labilithrix luteola TaxID=1391654 RepID=A0A0K1Q748_9BACT|nr:histidine kinase dimerization/phospho-acceptor domain-containing protein [Labilithrix luteola]AKV01563.1 Sensory box histidine kinase [Labilithrix luteola]